jgi:protein-tyrosine-phosphatase
MAEGLFSKYATENFEPVSTGTRHRSQIKPLAVEVMGEVGIDIGSQKPKEITGEMMRNATKIIYTGACIRISAPHCFSPKSRIVDRRPQR